MLSLLARRAGSAVVRPAASTSLVSRHLARTVSTQHARPELSAVARSSPLNNTRSPILAQSAGGISAHAPPSTYTSFSSSMYDIITDTWQGSKEEKVQDPEEVWQSRETFIVSHLEKPRNAYSGRSVPVHNREVGVAFFKLRRILTHNSVVRELRMAERHEKKGDKRRRLQSQRWRRRFAHEVRKKVQLVNEIRARGS